jgi:hypothetical protein
MFRTSLAILGISVTTVVILAHAADAPPIPDSNAALAKSRYSGRVQERNGSRWSDFEFDFTVAPPTMVMYRAERACKTARLVVLSDENGAVRLQSRSDIAGCPDRMFDLKASGDRLRGTLSVETRVFDVQASKK